MKLIKKNLHIKFKGTFKNFEQIELNTNVFSIPIYPTTTEPQHVKLLNEKKNFHISYLDLLVIINTQLQFLIQLKLKENKINKIL